MLVQYQMWTVDHAVCIADSTSHDLPFTYVTQSFHQVTAGGA